MEPSFVLISSSFDKILVLGLYCLFFIFPLTLLIILGASRYHDRRWAFMAKALCIKNRGESARELRQARRDSGRSTTSPAGFEVV